MKHQTANAITLCDYEAIVTEMLTLEFIISMKFIHVNNIISKICQKYIKKEMDSQKEKEYLVAKIYMNSQFWRK